MQHYVLEGEGETAVTVAAVQLCNYQLAMMILARSSTVDMTPRTCTVFFTAMSLGS